MQLFTHHHIIISINIMEGILTIIIINHNENSHNQHQWHQEDKTLKQVPSSHVILTIINHNKNHHHHQEEKTLKRVPSSLLMVSSP